MKLLKNLFCIQNKFFNNCIQSFIIFVHRLFFKYHMQTWMCAEWLWCRSCTHCHDAERQCTSYLLQLKYLKIWPQRRRAQRRDSRIRLSFVVSLYKRSCVHGGTVLLRGWSFGQYFFEAAVPWPPSDLRAKFYGDCLRGTPLSGALNARVLAIYISVI